MYYNTSYVATLEYKRLSLPLMLRQFTLNTSAVQCGSDTTTEADCGHSNACVYSSHATHVSEVALRAASVKIHAYASFE